MCDDDNVSPGIIQNCDEICHFVLTSFASSLPIVISHVCVSEYIFKEARIPCLLKNAITKIRDNDVCCR